MALVTREGENGRQLRVASCVAAEVLTVMHTVFTKDEYEEEIVGEELLITFLDSSTSEDTIVAIVASIMVFRASE
jgi:hypothetical protein